MTVNEFSNQFDVLYDNITSNKAPGLNEYEKSVFLTKAQDEIIKNYFSPKGNPKQDGYDDTPKRQADFSKLIKVQIKEMVSGATFDPRSILYEMPDDVFIVVNEQIHFVDSRGEVEDMRQVIPISFSEYSRLMSRPYKEPLKYQAWRLLTLNEIGEPNILAEIIVTSSDKSRYSEDTIKYVIRYVRRPNPIRLVDFSESFGEDVTIDGGSGVSECELDPILHEEILQRAVELAKIAWSGEPAAIVQAGQRSE